jgi:undecaprenyl-diphosphatase
MPPDRFSFSSGHAITVFAVAISPGHFYPAFLPALLFCAATVAASCVLPGMYFLSHVVVGALGGAVPGHAAVAVVI